jgi:hypothetical protein
MIALTKIMRFARRIQKTKEDAARFRFLICQTIAGVSIMSTINASTGTAIAAGVSGNIDSAMTSDV